MPNIEVLEDWKWRQLDPKGGGPILTPHMRGVYDVTGQRAMAMCRRRKERT